MAAADTQQHDRAISASLATLDQDDNFDEDGDDSLLVQEAVDRCRQCDLLATALAEYCVDGRAAVTMPLLAVARDPRDAALLPDLARNVHRLGQAVEDNAAFLADVLDACPGLREFVSGVNNEEKGRAAGCSDQAQDDTAERSKKRQRGNSMSEQPLEWSSPEREQHREDVRCVLKQLAREWSEDGAEERRHIHGPVLEALVKYVPAGGDSSDLASTRGVAFDAYGRESNRLASLVAAARQPQRLHDHSQTAGQPSAVGSCAGGVGSCADGGNAPFVLVPGSGLGRLACEIAAIDLARANSCSDGTAMSIPKESVSRSARGYNVEACESGAVMSAVAEMMIRLTPEHHQQPWRYVSQLLAFPLDTCAERHY